MALSLSLSLVVSSRALSDVRHVFSGRQVLGDDALLCFRCLRIRSLSFRCLCLEPVALSWSVCVMGDLLSACHAGWARGWRVVYDCRYFNKPGSYHFGVMVRQPKC